MLYYFCRKHTDFDNENACEKIKSFFHMVHPTPVVF